MAEVIELEVTTNASGAGTVTASVRQAKLLYKVEWNVGTFAAGVDATLKDSSARNGSDVTLLTLTDANSDAVHYPRVLESDNAGAALSTYAMPMIEGDVTLTIAAGGDSKTGALYLHCLEA